MSSTKTTAGDGPAPLSLPFLPGTYEVVGFCQYAPLAAAGSPTPTLASVICRARGWRLVVMVKAAFNLTTSPMEPAPAPPVQLRDTHRRNNPIASLVTASDLVPGRTRVDVTAIGHACAAEPVEEMAVRLAVAQDGGSVIDKQIAVRAAASFTRFPLVYERAPGGPGTDNPLGVHADDDEEPELFDPADPTRPIGFGPIASHWPSRKRLVDKKVLAGLEQLPIQLPDDIDWRFFQAAPDDQQLTHLSPHATFVLEGFHAGYPRLEAALPGAVAVGAVFGLDRERPDVGRPLDFRADTVTLDGDRLWCTVTWRAVIEVASEADVPGLVIAAGVHTDAAPLEVPSARPEVEVRAAPPSSPAAQPADLGGTWAVHAQTGAGATLPFGPSAVPASGGTGPPAARATLSPTSSPSSSLPFTSRPSAAPQPVASKLPPAVDSGRTLGSDVASLPFVPSGAEPARLAEPPPPATTPATPSGELTAAASIDDAEEVPPPPEPAAEASPAKATPADRPKKKKKVKPKKEVQRKVSTGTDLNALLYGKK